MVHSTRLESVQAQVYVGSNPTSSAMNMINVEAIISWLEKLAQSIRLEYFVVLGSILEEIIVPIPSPFVMTTAAFVAKSQNLNLYQVSMVCLAAAIAKTVMSWVFYVITDKAEDIIIGKFGKYIGISHKNVEKIGSMLTGKWWNDIALFLLRAIPIFPTSLVTIAAGAIKYPMKPFLVVTFIGTMVRNYFYIWVGYFGYDQINKYFGYFKDNLWSLVGFCLVVGLVVVGLMKAKDKMLSKIVGE